MDSGGFPRIIYQSSIENLSKMDPNDNYSNIKFITKKCYQIKAIVRLETKLFM